MRFAGLALNDLRIRTREDWAIDLEPGTQPIPDLVHVAGGKSPRRDEAAPQIGMNTGGFEGHANVSR
jgi:hypothetical protein